LMTELDPQREIPNNEELFYFEEREDVGDWFRRHGWHVTVTPSDQLMAGYGRSAPKEVEDTMPGNLFVSAQRVQR
jgi:O-methyltransferase involved in polyketide biosynthesis